VAYTSYSFGVKKPVDHRIDLLKGYQQPRLQAES